MSDRNRAYFIYEYKLGINEISGDVPVVKAECCERCESNIIENARMACDNDVIKHANQYACDAKERADLLLSPAP